MKTKSVAIANAVSMLVPGGILFGSTILANPKLHTKMSTRLCSFYNKEGIFSNKEDSLESLQDTLEQHLTDVEITVVGCVALFKGNRKQAVS